MPKKSDKVDKGDIQYQITSDLVLDLYEEVRKLKGKAKKEGMEKVKLLSKRIGDYIVKLDKNEQ